MRFRSIDALRGFAAVWVFAYHLWNVFCPGYSRQADPCDMLPINADTPAEVVVSLPIFGFGYAGIGLFFVLSGFCIHLPQAQRYHRTGSDNLQLKPFAVRRFRRLYPTFFVSLFVASLAYFLMNICWRRPLGPEGLTLEYIKEASGFGWIGVNALFLLALNPQALGLNGVYWTLWYEVQFYLAYPWMLRIVRQIGFQPVAVILMVVELAFAVLPVPESLKGWQPLFEWFFLRRYFEWFLGMMLAEKLAAGNPLKRSTAGILAIFGFIFGALGTAYPWCWAIHETAFAIGSCGLVGWLLAKPKVGPESHAVRCFSWFGEFSYSLYLIHMPILRMLFAVETLLPDTIREMGSFTAAGVASLFAAPAAAWCLYHVAEKPYLKSAPVVQSVQTQSLGLQLPLEKGFLPGVGS